MKSIIFDGNAFASKKVRSLKTKILKLKKRSIIPHLNVILVGNSPASKIYTSLIDREAKRIGVKTSILNLKTPNKKELLSLIHKMNEDKLVNGILIQMPLPDNFTKKDSEEIINELSLKKDIDGLRKESLFSRPTSKAILEIIELAQRLISPFLRKKATKVVLVGATGTVGQFLASELKKRNFDLIECNSKTINLKDKTLKADILISATGKPKLITEGMIKRGAIILDVGSPKQEVNFESVSRIASFITPVPGGIGPVTIACLLENLIQSTNLCNPGGITSPLVGS
jgi:methylenetetrahydrofolate dehydrogenase (NADP+)/methenyltetrahydrofolate cyclohydrolase